MRVFDPRLAPPLIALFVPLLLTTAASARRQDEPVPMALPAAEPAAPAEPAEPAAPAASAEPAASAAPNAPEAADPNVDDAEPAVAEPRFGTHGQWVLTSDFDATFATTSYANTEAKYHSYGVSPSVDWFAANDLAVGGFVSGGLSGSTRYRNGEDLETTSTTSWAVGARLSVNVPLSRALSLWIRGRFSYSSSFTRPERNGAPDANALDLKDSGANVGVSLPLLLHVAPHAFVGFGPWFTRTIAHSQSGYLRPTGDGTFLGAQVTIGGYL